MTINDVLMKGAPKDLLPGDPVCAPMRTVLAESTVALLRSLSVYPLWRNHIGNVVTTSLQEIKNLPQLSVSKQQELQEGNMQSRYGESREVKIQVRPHCKTVLTQDDLSESVVLVIFRVYNT